MVLRSYKSLILLIFLNQLTPQISSAHEGCKYSGKILDTSKSSTELGTQFISEIPENFTGKKECYHSNTKISETSEYVKGKKSGLMKSFNDKGHIQEEAMMNDDIRDGFFKRYHHDTNKLIQEWDYSKGILVGLAKEYFEDSGKIKSLKMISPNQNGSEMYFNKSGKLTHLACKNIPLKEDKDLCGRNGLGKKVSLYFSEEDNLNQTLTYKNLKLEGEVLSFNNKKEIVSKKVYKNGELLSEDHFSAEGNYKSLVDGKKTTETFYFASGKLKQITLKNGFDIISDKEFYENGSKKKEYESKNDVVYITTYYDNNQINCTYKNKNVRGYNFFDGPYNCFYENGKPSSKENYADEKLDGEQSYFSDKGLIFRKTTYKNGLLIESWDYDDKGQLSENHQYEPDGSRKLK